MKFFLQIHQENRLQMKVVSAKAGTKFVPMKLARMSYIAICISMGIIPISNAATAVKTTTSTPSQVYKVKEGETLNGIANRLGVSARQLASDNNKKNTDILHIDEVLFIPNNEIKPQTTTRQTNIPKPRIDQVSTTKSTVIATKTPSASATKHPLNDRQRKTTISQSISPKQPAELTTVEKSGAKSANQKTLSTDKPVRTIVYTVVEGDTLLALAKNFNASVTQLQQLNPNLKPSNLTIGQKLNVPSQKTLQATPVVEPTTKVAVTKSSATNSVTDISPTISIDTYTVKEGDTLSALASQFNLSRNDLAKINQLLPDASLQAGQTLLIPVTVNPEKSDNKY